MLQYVSSFEVLEVKAQLSFPFLPAYL